MAATIKTILLFLIYKSFWYFLPSFEWNDLSVQERKFKTDFQDGGHHEFLIAIILATFYLQVAQILHIKFEVSLLFSSGKRIQNNFFPDGGHDGHLGFPIEKILAFFDLQVTPICPIKFRFNWPFHSREEVQNRFSKWPWWQHFDLDFRSE